jgi:4a-hydroxytetrahydrobiopterin dehydratase
VSDGDALFHRDVRLQSVVQALDEGRSLLDTHPARDNCRRLREVTMSLTEKHSTNKAAKLTPTQIEALVPQVPGYELDEKSAQISKEYSFPDFYETIAFVNAVAYIANQEDHHPDLAASYGMCKVSFSTHDAGGLTENDFICAAKVNALVRD